MVERREERVPGVKDAIDEMRREMVWGERERERLTL